MVEPPASGRALLLRTLRRNLGPLSASALLITVWQAAEAAVPVVIGLVVDEAVGTSDRVALAWSAAALCALFAVLSYAYRFGARIGFAAMQRQKHELRLEIAGHVLRPDGARTGRLPGEVLSLATADTELVGDGMRFLNRVVAALVTIGLVAWLLLRTDLVLGVVVLVGAPAVLLIVQALTPRVARDTGAQQEAIARATGMATDLIKGLRPLKGVGGERAATDRYRRLSRTAQRASIRTATSYGWLTGLSTALNALFLAAVAGVAGRLAIAGEISIGELIAVIGLAQFLAEPMAALADIGASLASMYAAAGRIAGYLRTDPLLITTGEHATVAPYPPVALEAVRSGPLTGLDLATRPGELLGIVVPDPGTADRLVELLRGEVPSADRDGRIVVAGLDHDTLAIDALRRTIVVAPHRADVLEGTIGSNIVPPGAAGTAAVTAVIEASAVGDLVALHEAGLDHRTSAGGSTLSGGQRQRIALARALAADPPVLVLHEPTTAVDAVTEQHIAEGLRRLRHSPGSLRTTIVLTSSPALLAQADRVVLVVDGRTAAEGDHPTLAGLPAYREAVLR